MSERIYTRLKRILRYNYLRLMRQRASARALAKGLAIGVFGGCLPVLWVFPLQVVVAVAIAFVLRSSKVAAIIGTWISNPITAWAFYPIQYAIGRHLVPFEVAFDPSTFQPKGMLSLGWQVVTVLVVGGVALGIPSSIGSYYIFLPIIRGYRKRRALRILRKKTRDTELHP
jgi:hypothetical protein